MPGIYTRSKSLRARIGSNPTIALTATNGGIGLTCATLPQSTDVQVPAQPQKFRRELDPFRIDWAEDLDLSGWERVELLQKMAHHSESKTETTADEKGWSKIVVEMYIEMSHTRVHTLYSTERNHCSLSFAYVLISFVGYLNEL